MSEDRIFLAAFTPTQQQDNYKSYPPYINFSRVGDKIKITMRGHEELYDSGLAGGTYMKDGPTLEVYFDAQCMKWLLEDVAEKLKDGR